MATTRKTTKTGDKPKGVPILLRPEMVARIDALRDPLVPRAAFVKDLIDKALKILEQEPGR